MSDLYGKRPLEGRPMFEQRDEQIKALIEHHSAKRRRKSDRADMAEASRRGRLLQSEIEPKSPSPTCR